MAGQHRKSQHLKQIIHNLVKRFYRLHRRLRRIVVRQVYQVIRQWQRRSRRLGMAGFVLPTTTLLLLVIALTVGAIIHRAYSHTNQIIGEAQQRVIYNAASPAIDRARAKLETMFDPEQDNRYPGGIPAENHLAGMLRNDGSYGVAALPGAPATDIYTLPGERRINLDGATKTGEQNAVDNAWAFRTDTNGDGRTDATVVYSILLQTPRQNDVTNNNAVVPGSGLLVTNDLAKAQNLWVRTAPLSNRQQGNCSTVSTEGIDPGLGWFQDSTSSSILRKNFQIDAIVIPDTATNRPNFVTLEMQQDRQLDRGNKWGAWFRNDMEIYPGATMNWNGAMHTEGNLIVENDKFNAYLVSAKNSCLMSIANNSEITVTNIPNPGNDPNQKPDFLGGVLRGSLKNNNYNGSDSSYHLFPAPNPGNLPTIAKLTTGTDSATGTSPALMALDPIALLTRDVSLARGTADPSNRSNIEANWKGLEDDSVYPRITNQAEPKPYVDDLYRADDRWGPKPRYSDNIVLRGANQQPGTLITSGNVTNPDDLNTLTNTTIPADGSTTGMGLDGYWERRALAEGLRLIVGQRLELGNPFGWTNTDPLYPPDATTLSHEQRQRRALRDNPASVQASAIYHVGSGNANFPVACLASTSHPGSLGSLTNSITFNTTSINGNQALLTDFLTGYGTNGWEFAPPGGTEANFAIAIGVNQPLGKALRNLANFAGDPAGAFPPLQEAGRVHPYPNLTMWGNYSELRRTLARLDSGVAYSALSPADKTTLHTAACTLGMLSYNLETFQGYNYADSANAGNGGSPGLAMLGNKIFDLIDGKTNNGEVRNPATGQYFTFTGKNQPGAAYYDEDNPTDPNNGPNTYSRLPPEAFVTALLTEPMNPSLSQQDKDALAIIARTVIGKQQVERDRIFGFKEGTLPPPPTSSGYWITNNRTYQAQGQGGSDLVFSTGCDPETFPLNNSGNPTAQARQRVALALSFCESTPRYPSLFYIFPKENHDHDGATTPTPINIWQGNQQPTTEGYISDTHISGTVNNGVTYRIVSNTTNLDDFSGVTILPKATDFSTWVLPQSTPQNITNANVSPNRIVVNGVVRAVAFLDRVIFNGREMLPTRVMDIDVGMLRGATHATATGGQPWLPLSGVVYAFREDAVREDAIARPAGAAGNPTNATNNNAPTDPPLITTPEGIVMSPKQVDYVPDPDRRPYGFRLRNGSQVSRNTALNIPIADNVRGLSFFTDDTVYIQGDFNRHQNGADDSVGSRLEEFTDQLNGAYNETSFYARSTRDSSFARPASDRWRPSEILADALHIVSDNFCDGSFQDMFITPTASAYHNPSTSTSPGYGLWGPGCVSAGSNTSFRLQNLPTPTGTVTWLRESPGDTALTVPTTGIKIDRNGQPLLSGATPYTGTYQNFTTNKSTQRTTAANTTVNTILVSGIVPSQPNQAYGGLHNFPRLLESWSGRTLQFNGSFLQLNFSNYATAPYDQDAWEPTQSASSSEWIEYYKNAPTRAWGYDPALQLAPAGPAAARFITASRNRNEFFTEVSANDAFMRQLCTAFNNIGAKSGDLDGAPTSVPCP